jgi:hypothetical protein
MQRIKDKSHKKKEQVIGLCIIYYCDEYCLLGADSHVVI